MSIDKSAKANNEFVPVVDTGRRKFIANIAALGSAAVLSQPLFSRAEKTIAESWTVGQIMDLFIKEVPGAPFATTVDTLKSGSRDTVVKGIVTTMFPTLEIIQKTIDVGANFIIVHEPSFYNHLDETKWLENDEVFQYKKNLLDKHGIIIWRNHDYIHRHNPDGVLDGVSSVLGWQAYADKDNRNIFSIPSTSLQNLIQHVKTKLNIAVLRYIGDLSQPCKKIALLPGAAGGRRQIELIGATKPDVLICGELQEWETAEYIRDAQIKGQKTSLIILGHAVSEEPGAAYLASWLKNKLPGIKVTHIASKNPLNFL